MLTGTPGAQVLWVAVGGGHSPLTSGKLVMQLHILSRVLKMSVCLTHKAAAITRSTAKKSSLTGMLVLSTF